MDYKKKDMLSSDIQTDMLKKKAKCFLAIYIGIGSPIVLFILISFIVVLWKLKIEYLISFNAHFKSSGV